MCIQEHEWSRLSGGIDFAAVGRWFIRLMSEDSVLGDLVRSRIEEILRRRVAALGINETK